MDDFIDEPPPKTYNKNYVKSSQPFILTESMLSCSQKSLVNESQVTSSTQDSDATIQPFNQDTIVIGVIENRENRENIPLNTSNDRPVLLKRGRKQVFTSEERIMKKRERAVKDNNMISEKAVLYKETYDIVLQDMNITGKLCGCCNKNKILKHVVNRNPIVYKEKTYTNVAYTSYWARVDEGLNEYRQYLVSDECICLCVSCYKKTYIQKTYMPHKILKHISHPLYKSNV